MVCRYSTPWDRVDAQTKAYKDFVTKYTPMLERSGGFYMFLFCMFFGGLAANSAPYCESQPSEAS